MVVQDGILTKTNICSSLVLRAEKVEARNLLKSLQGNYLRAVIGAMKITPMEA